MGFTYFWIIDVCVCFVCFSWRNVPYGKGNSSWKLQSTLNDGQYASHRTVRVVWLRHRLRVISRDENHDNKKHEGFKTEAKVSHSAVISWHHRQTEKDLTQISLTENTNKYIKKTKNICKCFSPNWVWILTFFLFLSTNPWKHQNQQCTDCL